MTCEQVERDEVAEAYVVGRLDEDGQAAFEAHYFECPECLARVQALQHVREALEAQPPPGRRPVWRRAAGVLAAAALVVLAVRGVQEAGRDRVPVPSPRDPAVDTVLPAPVPSPEVELPPYAESRLRSAPDEAQRVFRAAMRAYRTDSCVGAIDGLRDAVGRDADFVQARFYLGACELHGGNAGEAITHLQRVAAAGESPYLEEAHWFLAHARLRQGEREAARDQLRRVIELHGDRRADAERLLSQLR